ncbi:GNAT family N-acetyltransferase [Tardisphaera miroshnichenkoae]
MQIGIVSEGDREEITDMTRDTWPWGDYIADVFDRWLRDGIFLKAVESSRIVGIVHLKIFPDYAWIEGLRVRKTERRKGIGRYMLEQSMKATGRTVHRALISEENVASRSLFESLGFRVISRVYYNHGPDGVPPLLNVRPKPGASAYLDDWTWYPEHYCKGLYEGELDGAKATFVKANPLFLVEGALPSNYEFTSSKKLEGTEGFVVVERSAPRTEALTLA